MSPPGASLTEKDMAMVDKLRAARDSFAGSIDLRDWKNPNQSSVNAQAKALLDQMKATNPTMQSMGAVERDKQLMNGYKTLVFASQSLGHQGLNEILQAVSGRPDTVVVLRGVPAGMKLGEGVMAVQQLAASITPMPNVIINPTLFKEYKVAVVPTIVALADKEGGGTELAGRVSGIADPVWLLRQMSTGKTTHGKRRDFGKAGPVEEISEPDLIEVAKKKVLEIDWGEKKRQAQARFWKKQTFNELPAAARSATREFDPSIVLTDNIQVDGSLIALKGTRINPLELRAFTQALVVFDPLDKRQVRAVKSALPGLKATPGVQRVTLIATRLDAELGWDSYKQVTEEFDAPVFLLTPDIISRFGLEHTPSIVTAKNKKFMVREIGVGLH